MEFIYRKALLADADELESLIQVSAKSINAMYYTEAEIDAALGNAWTVDRRLILDNTYWVAENADGMIVGCGGWSKRKLLFGKSKDPHASGDELTPGIEPAKIRAFFVHPDFIRKGVGKGLLEKCETEAWSQGFTSLELVATLSGEKLYSSSGYLPVKGFEIELGGGVTNKVISMRKQLS